MSGARAITKPVIAVLMGVTGLAGYVLAAMTVRADPALLDLVERLVEGDRSASIIAVGLVAATSILAAVLIPAVTVFTVLRHERNQAYNENSTYLDPHPRHGRLSDAPWLDADPDHSRTDTGHDQDRAAQKRLHRHRPTRCGSGT